MSLYLTYNSGGIGGGSSSSEVQASKTVALASGQISQSFVYSAYLSINNAPIISIANTVDALPIFLQCIVTAYSILGFTVTFNVAPDSGNYKLSYVVVNTI